MDKFKEKQENIKIQASTDETVLPEISTRYTIIKNIGQGGMGTIYEAIDLEADSKKIAIKVLSEELCEDNSALKRFEKEIEAVTRLNHPNLVSVLDHGITGDGRPYLVMDFFEGITLADYLKNSKVQISDMLSIFIQIADALETAHVTGVVHHDLKPSNIILVKTDNDTIVPKIIDFGIARINPLVSSQVRETHNLTNTGDGLLGTPLYMSPEQCLGFKLDARADIYSLGCIMYESFTGSPPQTGNNPVQIVVGHINETPPAWKKLSKAYEQLEAVVFKCLEKDKEDRYQSSGELKADLELVLKGKKVSVVLKEKEPEPIYSKREMFSQLMKLAGYGFCIFTLSLYPTGLTILFPFLCLFFVFKHVTKFGFSLWTAQSTKNWDFIESITRLLLGFTGTIFYLTNIGAFEFLNPSLQVLLIINFFVHIISAWACLAAALGNLFNRHKLESWKKSLLKFSGLMIPFMVIFYYILPFTLINSYYFYGYNNDDITVVKSCNENFKIALLKASVEANPQNSLPIQNLNKLLIEKNKSKEAIEITSKLIEKNPDSNELLRLRAKAYLAAGDTSNALVDIKKALSINPPKTRGLDFILIDTSSDLFCSKSLLHEVEGDIYFNQKDYVQAIESWKKVDDRWYYANRAYEKLAIASFKLGRKEDAIKYMNLACREEYSQEKAVLMRGILNELMGHEEQAKKDYGQLIELMKRKESFNRNSLLSRLRVEQFSYEAAAEDLARAFAYRKLGEEEKANKLLKQAQDFGYTKEDLLSDFSKALNTPLPW